MMDRHFQRRVMEGYLAAMILIMTIITYVLLSGVGFEVSNEFIVVAILIIILISINALHAIIQLRMLNYLDSEE